MLGLIGVECRTRGSSSSDLLDSWMVHNAVLMVLTCHLMKPLDLGKWGEEVM